MGVCVYVRVCRVVGGEQGEGRGVCVLSCTSVVMATRSC